MKIGCVQCVELLPWLLNESLDEGERSSLLGHLRSCSDCQREWEGTQRAAWMLEQHVPSRDLVDHVLGIEMLYSSQIIENHLAACDACRREAETMTAEGRVVLMRPKAEQDHPAATRRAATRGHRAWLVAASLAAAVLIALLWSSPQTSRPVPGQLSGGEASDLAMHADSVEITVEGFEQAALEGATQPDEGLHADGFDSGGLGSWSHIEKSGQDPTG